MKTAIGDNIGQGVGNSSSVYLLVADMVAVWAAVRRHHPAKISKLISFNQRLLVNVYWSMRADVASTKDLSLGRVYLESGFFRFAFQHKPLACRVIM